MTTQVRITHEGGSNKVRIGRLNVKRERGGARSAVEVEHSVLSKDGDTWIGHIWADRSITIEEEGE